MKTRFTFLILFSLSFNYSYCQSNDEFKLCGDERTFPYYNCNLKYEGDFWEIKNHFKLNYKQSDFVNIANNSGIITVQFKVNCKSEAGDFSTQSCDLDYLPNQVNSLIVDHLLELTKQLTKWKAGKDNDGNFVNSHAFLSFRIVEGIITEILPK